MPVIKSVSISEEQNAWLEKNHISLSALVQDAIDNEIKKRKMR